MAETSRNAGESSTNADIPTGLNRIRTRRVSSKDNQSSKLDEYNNLIDSQSFGGSRTHLKQKQKSSAQGHVNINGSKEGNRKGRKIAQWFTSYLFKDPDQAFGDIPPNTNYSDPKVKALDKDFLTRKISKVGKNSAGKQSSLQSTSSSKFPKVLKSFSHELGPKGGIRPVQLRAHSFNDLKDLSCPHGQNP